MNIERLIKCHYAAAKIVEKLGDGYLIFFERINKEVKKAEKQEGLKMLVAKVVKCTQKSVD